MRLFKFISKVPLGTDRVRLCGERGPPKGATGVLAQGGPWLKRVFFRKIKTGIKQIKSRGRGLKRRGEKNEE